MVTPLITVSAGIEGRSNNRARISVMTRCAIGGGSGPPATGAVDGCTPPSAFRHANTGIVPVHQGAGEQ